LMVFRPQIYLVAPLDSEGLSIYSTYLYQGVKESSVKGKELLVIKGPGPEVSTVNPKP